MTEHLARINPLDITTQREGVEEEFVVGLLVFGQTCPMMEPTPNVPRRFAEPGNRPLFPGEGTMTARFPLEIMASQASREGDEHHPRQLDVGVQSTM